MGSILRSGVQIVSQGAVPQGDIRSPSLEEVWIRIGDVRMQLVVRGSIGPFELDIYSSQHQGN